MSTHKPDNRAEFKEFVLRGLGKPVININISDEQVEDCVEIALSYYVDYHYDGSFLTYLKHELTQTNVDNGYITVDENVIGIKRIFPIGSALNSSNMFSYQYQASFSMMSELSS